MNNSYLKNGRFDSNSGIYEGFFTESETRLGRADRLLSKLFSVARALTGAKAKRIGKVCVVIGCLLAMIGVVGAMEAGSVSLLAGLGISALLLGTEYFCFRRS